MQRRRSTKRTLLFAAALAIAATPLAAAAQPPGAHWRGDICHQPPPAGQEPVQCLAYPPRVETHQHSCRWVEAAYGGAAHQFEVCRGPDGLWRPSGRS
jgi:hypothetical protein